MKLPVPVKWCSRGHYDPNLLVKITGLAGPLGYELTMSWVQNKRRFLSVASLEFGFESVRLLIGTSSSQAYQSVKEYQHL